MEICVDSLESAKNAVNGGATRLELCAALSEGGLTPSPGLVKLVRNSTTLPIYAMIRVRAGNFFYDRDEMDAMLYDLKILKEHRVNGFVFGALTSDRDIDVNYCKEIVSAASPLPVTFHRAFDEVNDPLKALETLIDLGFERILTSGQRNTAEEGLELLKEIVRRAAERISIMPGSGITPYNILKIKMATEAKEFHASAKKRKIMAGESNSVRIGATPDQDFINVTDSDLVKEMVRIIEFREKFTAHLTNFRDEEIPSNSIINKLIKSRHKLQQKSGKVSKVRRYCKKCYEDNATHFGRDNARKLTKQVITFCDSCTGQPFLCIPCFNNIH